MKDFIAKNTEEEIVPIDKEIEKRDEEIKKLTDPVILKTEEVESKYLSPKEMQDIGTKAQNEKAEQEEQKASAPKTPATPAKMLLTPKENNIITEKLKTIGAKEDDFNKIPEWGKLSYGERLLAIEQISQDTLSRVKEIGEQRFQEKNKISFKRKDFNLGSFSKKAWHNIGKSFWISKAEKETLKDFETGNLKPNSEHIKQIIERTADMNLNVVEKDGQAFIEFVKIDKSLPKEEQEKIQAYNEAANKYAKMPDAWRNKNAANSKDKGVFKNKNYQYFSKIEELYTEASTRLMLSQKEKFTKEGMNEKEAEKQAMINMGGKDFEISIIQFTNTNPDAVAELKRIRNESSYGRLFNNENLWRSLYMGIGFGTRTATKATLGLFAAPLVSSVIGGARARRKAGQKIDTAFMEGRTTETFKERKEAGKSGMFDDKNENRGLISKTFTGKNINAKEVGAFVDADSQIQRLDNLIQKLELAKTNEEKLLLKDQLNARIGYIENKKTEGLINYGTKNALGTNYALFKKLSLAQAEVGLIEFLNKKQIERRETLLGKVIAENESTLDNKQASFKNSEMIRGAVVGAGSALLGYGIRYGYEHLGDIKEAIGLGGIKHNPEDILSGGGATGHGNLDHLQRTNISDHVKPKVFDPTKPAGGNTPDSNTPTTPGISTTKGSVAEFMKTNSNQNSIDFGMYKDGASMNVQSGTITFEDTASNYKVDIQYNSRGAIDAIQRLKNEVISHYHGAENVPTTANINTEYNYLDKSGVIKHSEDVLIKGNTNTLGQYQGTTKVFGSGSKVSTGTNTINNAPGKTIPQTDINGNPINHIPAKPTVLTTGGATSGVGQTIPQVDINGNPINHIPAKPTSGINTINAKTNGASSNVAETKTSGASSADLKTTTLTPEQLTAQTNLEYNNALQHFLPRTKDLSVWTNNIATSHGMAETILHETTLDPKYQPIQDLMKEIYEKTGIAPLESSTFVIGTTPEDYIKMGIEYAEKNNITLECLNY